MTDYTWICNACGASNLPEAECCRGCGATEGSLAVSPRGDLHSPNWFASTSAANRFGGALVLGEVFWFGMLFPIFPKTAVGWLFAVGVGAVFGPLALLLEWMQRQSNNNVAWKILGALIVLSLGVAIPWFFWARESFIHNNLPYWGR